MIYFSFNGALVLLTSLFLSSAAGTQDSARLRVKVLSGTSPVAGATVSLSRLGSAARSESPQYTDQAGECEFTQLASGNYSFVVSKPSFIALEAEATASEFSLGEGETRSFQSNLIKGGVIAGRLLNADNEVLTGIPVTALSTQSMNAARYDLPARSESNVTSLSDDRGIFRIYGLRPGTYVIAVNAQRDSSLRKDILPFKYLGGPDSSSGGVFVGLSQELQLPDLQLAAGVSEVGSMTGHVLGKGNLPLAQATVFLQGEDLSIYDRMLTNAAGSFAFEGLVPGKYRISVTPRQISYRPYVKEIDLSPKRTTNLVVTLLEYPVVAGRTYLLRNKTPEPFPSLNVALVPVGGGDDINFVSGSDGNFSMRSNRTGSFSWNLPRLDKNQYLAYVASGNKEITSSPLLLGESSITDIAVYISTGAAGIEGRFPEGVRNGCATLGVYAVLVDSVDSDSLLRKKRADICTSDSFAIYSLPPGGYYLVALPWLTPPAVGYETFGDLPASQDAVFRAALRAAKLNQTDVVTLENKQTAAGRTAHLLSIPGSTRSVRPGAAGSGEAVGH